MKRIRHSPEQIIRKLREADAELAKGIAVPEVCKALSIAENTYYRWRNQFGGIKADEMKRLKELERENARLKALVAELSLDKAILKEVARGNSRARPGGEGPSSRRWRPSGSPSVGPAEPWVCPGRASGTSGPNENERESCCCGSGPWPGRIPATATVGSRPCWCEKAGRSTSSGSIGSGVERA